MFIITIKVFYEFHIRMQVGGQINLIIKKFFEKTYKIIYLYTYTYVNITREMKTNNSYLFKRLQEPKMIRVQLGGAFNIPSAIIDNYARVTYKVLFSFCF